MSARDIRYGRRGGRWASPDAGRHRQAIADALAQCVDDRRPVDVDAGVLFHPDTIARHRAHDRRSPGTCAKDAAASKAERQRVACTCQPDPVDLEAVWSGRARMATARRNTGQPLDAIDRQALARMPAAAVTTAPAGRQRAAAPVAQENAVPAPTRLFDPQTVPEGAATR